ncbi:hypothetical protein E5676_scaffold98G002250 [Cucumis melo var. makuwa]|uniref:Uncharacterized protein n=1 Tax=Cucumis melo var. makuwa TaxID=1194695 RepID=A0A5D3C3F2_CUCMM|nr:hypothetical protein E5676_scaffold98G002250 [Cucumis melo var. makuwa]
MAIHFNKFSTIAAALLIHLILCSILSTTVAASNEQLLNVANTNVITASAAEYQAFDIGKPLYRVKEQYHVPDLVVENLDSISSAPKSAPSPSPSPSPLG